MCEEKKMSCGCEPARDMTLPEEIQALKAYNVPEHVINRISRKVEECGEWEKRRIEDRERAIKEQMDLNTHKDAVIDALGAYLTIKWNELR